MGKHCGLAGSEEASCWLTVVRPFAFFFRQVGVKAEMTKGLWED